MLSFQPRSVTTKKPTPTPTPTATATKKPDAASGETTEKKPPTDNGNQEKPKLSNADFRNMLLKK